MFGEMLRIGGGVWGTKAWKKIDSIFSFIEGLFIECLCASTVLGTEDTGVSGQNSRPGADLADVIYF